MSINRYKDLLNSGVLGTYVGNKKVSDLYTRNINNQKPNSSISANSPAIKQQQYEAPVGTVNNTASSVASVNNNATPTSTANESSSTNNNAWKTIQQQIKANTLNSKNEVAMAQRHAVKNMDNYLKALGIQGTGLGQSSYIDLATQYSNQLADINIDERDALLTAQTEQAEKYDEEVKKLIELGAPASVVNEYLANIKSQGFETADLETYQKALGADSLTQAKQLFSDLHSYFNSEEFDGDATLYGEALTRLETAIKSGDQQALDEAYEYASNVVDNNGKLNGEVSPEKSSISSTYKKYKSVNGTEFIVSGVDTNGNVSLKITSGSNAGKVITISKQEFEEQIKNGNYKER